MRLVPPLLVASTALSLMAGGKAASQPAAVTIPVDVAANLVYIQGAVNGKGSLETVLDTGTSSGVVAPAVAGSLKLSANGATEAEGLGTGSSQTLKRVDKTSLAWGPAAAQLHLAGQQIAILPIDYITRQTGHATDAIFGGDLYANFSITVDYDHRMATFDPGRPVVRAGRSLPLQVLDDVPYVAATLSGADGSPVSGLFLLDTGTTGSLILNRHFLAAHPQLTAGKPFVGIPPINAVGGRIDARMVRVQGLDLGGYRLKEPVAIVPEHPSGALVDHGIAGIMGANILRRFVITWDYRGRRLWLTPTAHLDDAFEADASGLRLVVDPPDLATVRVAAVQAGSPAERAGIRTDDVVAGIDGVRDLPLWRIVEKLRRPGDTVVLSIRRNGRDRSLQLLLRRMV